jgi:hypothetical protein
MSEHIFAYGSDMCLGRFLEYGVHPQAPGAPGRLPGYSLRFSKRSSDDGSGKANVEPSAGGEVWGVLYTIPNNELPLLDKGEGGYRRIRERIVGDSEQVKAWVYIAKKPSNDTALRPFTWYRRFMVEGSRSHGLPPEYIRVLEAIEATDDQDPVRDREKRSIDCGDVAPERPQMRVELKVTEERFIEPAEKAWRASLQAVSPLTFSCLESTAKAEVLRHLDMPPGATANAELVPPGRILPGYASICLSEGFFQRSQDRQVVILFHETVHIRLYRGRLTENYRLIRQQPRCVDPTPWFTRDRDDLSLELLTCAQEVGVDKFIAAANCPPQVSALYFKERTSYYMNGEAHRYDDNRSPSLAIYRLFYRLLRAELGLVVIRDDAAREQLRGLRQQYAAQLRERAGENLPWFQDTQRKLLSVTVDTDTPDPDAYRELFDRVRSLPVPDRP